MLLNDLPDDCLLIIFNKVNNLDHLSNFSRVCSRWNQLIGFRLNNVKYLLRNDVTNTKYSETTVFMESGSRIKDTKLILPNLKIYQIKHPNSREDLQTFAQNNQSINGLIYTNSHARKSFVHHFHNLEIIVTNWMDSYFNNREAALRLKQIFLVNDNFNSICSMVCNLENLQRLHIDDYEWGTRFYEGPKIPSLKMLELSTASYGGYDNFTGFHFMDFCPSLQSAFFHSDTHDYYVDTKTVNRNLRDLVIDHLIDDYGQRWDSLRSLLLKFPNLENLAIRSSDGISDENIEELVSILPKVKLLDFRYSRKITSKSADYCKAIGRSIVTYFSCAGDEPEDWPKIVQDRDQIVEGFDFMANCFFRKFRSLPLILYPMD